MHVVAQPDGINAPGFCFVNVFKDGRGIRHTLVPEAKTNAHFDRFHNCSPYAQCKNFRHFSGNVQVL